MNEEVIKGVADWLSVPVVLVAVAVMAAGALWLCWRTRSPSLLLERAWRILVGTSSSTERAVGKLLQEHQELLEIRFRHVPGLRTHRELLRLIEWLTAHDEEIGDVGRCGEYFDVAQLRVREEKMPRPWRVFVSGITLIVSLWFAIAAGALSFLSKPILQFNTTGTYLIFQRDAARPLLSKTYLRKDHCASPADAAELGFTPSEAKSLCELFSSPEAIQRFEREVPLQRAFAAFMAAFFGYFCYQAYQWIRRLVAAKDLMRRLSQRTAGASLLSECKY